MDGGKDLRVWGIRNPIKWLQSELGMGCWTHLPFRGMVSYNVFLDYPCILSFKHNAHRFITSLPSQYAWTYISPMWASILVVWKFLFQWVFPHIGLDKPLLQAQVVFYFSEHWRLWHVWHLQNAFIFGGLI